MDTPELEVCSETLMTALLTLLNKRKVRRGAFNSSEVLARRLKPELV